MQTVGAQWVIVRRGDAIVLAALVVAAARVPILAVAAPVGALADRLDRRRLLLCSQLFQGAVAAVLTVASLRGDVGPAMLLGSTALLGLGSAVSMIAFQALIPEVVEPADLPSAVAMAQVNLNIARVIGPPLGGLLVGLAGPQTVFALDACSYLVFAAVLVGCTVPAPPPLPAAGRLRDEVSAGIVAIRSTPVLRRAFLHITVTTLPYSAVWALLPSVAVHLLGLGATGYGVLLAAVGVGSIVGVVAYRALTTRLGATRLLVAANVAACALLVLVVLTGAPAMAVACLFGFGLASLVMQTQLGATVQVSASDQARARTLSVFTSLRVGGQGIGAIGFGLLGQATGAGPAMIVAGAGFGVSALVAMYRPPI
jgi:predicted MFS family arabinose efflux permease